MSSSMTRFSLLNEVLEELAKAGIKISMETVIKARKLLEDPRYTMRGASRPRIAATVTCVLNEAGIPVPIWIVISKAGLDGRNYRAVYSQALKLCGFKEGPEHVRILAAYAAKKLGFTPERTEKLIADSIKIANYVKGSRFAVAIALRQTGISYLEIQRVLGVSHRTLSEILPKIKAVTSHGSA